MNLLGLFPVIQFEILSRMALYLMQASYDCAFERLAQLYTLNYHNSESRHHIPNLKAQEEADWKQLQGMVYLISDDVDVDLPQRWIFEESPSYAFNTAIKLAEKHGMELVAPRKTGTLKNE